MKILFLHTGILKIKQIFMKQDSAFMIRLRKSESKSDTNKILEEYLYEAFRDRVPSKEEFISSLLILNF